MKLALKKGSTDVTVYIHALDSSQGDGRGLTGLVFNSASLVCYYVRPLGSATQLTLATQTVTGAHSDGGFVEVSSANMPGIYRLDLSDAICASGVSHAIVMLKGATNMAPVALEIQLTDVDLNDAVRGGMTALPNAAAEAAGGLYTRGTGAGQINQPANGMVDTNVVRWLGTACATPTVAGVPEVDVTHVAGSATTATLDTIKTETASIQSDTNDIQARLPAALVSGRMDASVGAIAAGAAATIQTECEEAIVAKNLDKLVLVSGTLATFSTGHTTTQVEVTGLPAVGDVTNFWLHCAMRMTSGPNAGSVRKFTTDTYGGSTGQHTFGFPVAWAATPTDGDGFVIFAIHDEQMRGTNSAALAANYTAARAAYLDNLNIGGTVASSSALATAQTAITLITDKLGAFTATGVNTVLGFLRALGRKDGGITTPSDMGGTYDHATDSQEAIRDRGDAAWVTGSAADPWSTALPGAYGAGTAGKIVADNLNATVSSRSSHTAADVWASGTRTLTSFGTLVADIWNALTSGMATAGSIGKKLSDWALGTDNRVLVSANAHTSGETVAAVTGAVGSVTGAVGSVTAAVTVGTNNDKTGYALTTAERDAIADSHNARNVSAVEGTASKTSLAGAILKLTAESEDNGAGSLLTKKTDGTTFATQTLTTDAALQPIKKLTKMV